MSQLRKMKSEKPYSTLQDVVASASVKTASRTPDILIYQIVDMLFAACEDIDNTVLETNPSGSGFLTMLRSFIDVQHISRTVLEDDWETLTSQQQQDFSMVFCNFLLHTYGNKLIRLLKQQGVREENIEIHSINQSPASSFAIIQVRLLQDDEESLDMPVKFHFVLGEWKVCDVTINDVSLIDDYRSMFKTMLQNNTISDLIATLIHQNEQLQVA